MEDSMKEQIKGVVINNQQYSNAVKQKAVKLYLKHGNLAQVSRLLDVPYFTLQHWRYRSGWWNELSKRVQDEQDRKLAGMLDQIVEKAIKKIEDRIDNGDHILDSKTGDVIQVPVKTRDLTSAVKALSERTDVLIGRATKDSVAKEMMGDKLSKLAKEFARFQSEKVIDGEYEPEAIETSENDLYIDDDPEEV